MITDLALVISPFSVFFFFLMTHILCIFLVTTDTFEQPDFQPHVVYLFV